MRESKMNRFEHEQKMEFLTRDENMVHSSVKKLSNASLRNQYFRQINLCKKTSLNYYEGDTFVKYLLDLLC